jgi:hypothetical protein
VFISTCSPRHINITTGKCCFPTHALHHVVAMLTTPGRQTFEQIRARWEAGEEEAAAMVGRTVTNPPTSGQDQDHDHGGGGSKFRRKLSYGLAFLSQRKTTPGRVQASKLSLGVTTVTGHRGDGPLSPTRSSKTFAQAADPTTHTPTRALTESPESAATPKALPRSQTTSFIPRPVRSNSDASLAGSEKTVKLQASATMVVPKLRTAPSKIPSPSPPLSERRVSSPRQYLPNHTSLNAKPMAAYQFASSSVDSPSKTVMRSRTTPNLVKAATSPQLATSTAPRKTGYKRPSASPTAQKSVLQENIPTSKRVTHRRSQQQEKPPRRESLVVPTVITNRRSFGSGTPVIPGRQSNRNTPLTAQKRLSTNLAQQTPLTVKRAQPSDQAIARTPESAQKAEVDTCAIAQPHLMGPRNTPVPTPTTLEPAVATPILARSITDKESSRKTLGTPNGLGGVWRSSRALATANHEVRRLPRSSTFHSFGTPREERPPVPPIPEHYRTPSLPSLVQSSSLQPDTRKPRHARMASEAGSCESIPEEIDENSDIDHAVTPSLPAHSPSESIQLSNYASDSTTALPTLPATSRSTTSLPPAISGNSLPGIYFERPWSISDYKSEDNADVEPHLQVRDYMPPLYWAGRFQARFDQWRTEAMMVELDPKHKPDGLLGECNLNQEKVAACYIFSQLRGLCLTSSAADSLWVSQPSLRPLFGC